jgi:hypothetical protein
VLISKLMVTLFYNPDEIICLIQRQEASSNATILFNDEAKAIEENEGSLILDMLDEEKTVFIDERLFFLAFAK